jgi:hypothetical protein
MTAEIRIKESKLSSRTDILEKIRQNDCIISVHEHIDNEELYFNNGRSIYYGQDLAEFQSSIPENCINIDTFKPKFFAAVFFACPAYERFRAINLSNEVRNTTDIYYDINNRVFEEIGVLQKKFMSSARIDVSGKLPVLPLPFLFVDPNQPASLFERRYAAVFNEVVGLKWHPYAQNKPPIDYVKSGYIDLAADYGLPTVIHSERPGERGDLAALFRDVSPAAEARKANVDFAHMGFLHPDFSPLQNFEHSFIDMAPWSSICLGEDPNLSINDRANKMAQFLSQHDKKLLFGLDTPYHWSLWSNGNTFGAEVSEEFEIINRAVRMIGAEAGKNLLCDNPKLFLGIK